MNDLWEKALEKLEHQVSEDLLDAWLRPIRFSGVENRTLVFRVPNKFHGTWVQNHFLVDIVEAFKGLCAVDPVPSAARWDVDESLRDKPNLRTVAREEQDRVHAESLTSSGLLPAIEPSRETSVGHRAAPAPASAYTQANLGTPLRAQCTFDTFVVGPSNQLAHAAGVAVGDSPGRLYNPLFIYGGVGLGKTHIVNAIGHEVRRKNPRARIVYVSAERFTNEFIFAIQKNQMEAFRERYRNQCDILLMDDIQFLAGREQTQDEFFHTFNALHHYDKQIVLTSDVYPQQIGNMQERLVSRFASGMVADIQPPELDTRIAILRAKAEREGLDLSEEAAHYIAQAIRSNVRELEGMLVRLAVQASMLRTPITLELARQAVERTTTSGDLSAARTVEDVQKAVCAYYGVRLADLKSKKRQRSITLPRMVAMYLCRQHLGTSYPEIGDRFGGKDHTTAINAVRKINGLVVEQDEQILQAVHNIERKLEI